MVAVLLGEPEASIQPPRSLHVGVREESENASRPHLKGATMSGSRQYRQSQKSRTHRRKRKKARQRDREQELEADIAEQEAEQLRVAKRRVEDAKVGMAIRKMHGI